MPFSYMREKKPLRKVEVEGMLGEYTEIYTKAANQLERRSNN